LDRQALAARSLIAAGTALSFGAFAVPLLGFGVKGVAAGSTAAAFQSAVYGGDTTGTFSVLQSIGATMAWAPLATGGAVFAGIGAGALLYQRRCKERGSVPFKGE